MEQSFSQICDPISLINFLFQTNCAMHLMPVYVNNGGMKLNETFHSGTYVAHLLAECSRVFTKSYMILSV